MKKRAYQSPRNTVFYLLERGGLFTLDAVAHSLHLAHKTAEIALDANVRLGRVIRDGEFYTIAEEYRVPWTLGTWHLLGERLLARIEHRKAEHPRYLHWATIWAFHPGEHLGEPYAD